MVFHFHTKSAQTREKAHEPWQKPYKLVFETPLDPNGFKQHGIRDPDLRDYLGKRLVSQIHSQVPAFDVVIGVDGGGMVPATSVANSFHKRLERVKKGQKYTFTYFNGKAGFDPLEVKLADARCLVVDDDAMTGRTLDNVKRIVEEAGGIVVGVAVLIHWPVFGQVELLGPPFVSASEARPITP